MRIVLLAIIILLFIMPIQGQQKAAEIRYICSDSIADYYEYRVKKDEPDVFVYAYNTQSDAYVGALKAGTWYPIRFEAIWRIGHTNYAFIYIGGYIIDFAMLNHVKNCDELNQENNAIPMTECLGIDPVSLGLPSKGTFVIDGNEYAYADNLSFFVPLDSFWTWDLTVGNTLILSFEQTSFDDCHITALYGAN